MQSTSESNAIQQTKTYNLRFTNYKYLQTVARTCCASSYTTHKNEYYKKDIENKEPNLEEKRKKKRKLTLKAELCDLGSRRKGNENGVFVFYL